MSESDPRSFTETYFTPARRSGQSERVPERRRMAARDRNILLGFMVLLAGVSPGALGQSVTYPGPLCGVKGSKVTLPCTFSTLKSGRDEEGREVLIEIRRVVWCQNHAVCQGSTQSVYDSESERNNPRYRYLGDKQGNCSLQISDLQEGDAATLRFRVEANYPKATFAGPPGVKVTVSDGDPMQIKNSREPDGAVSLLCSARCTFHQLEVTWSRDGHSLPQSGPVLRLSTLTAKDSGNYTCALKNDTRTESLPYRLHVMAADGGLVHQFEKRIPMDPMLVFRLVLFTLHTVLILTVTAILIRRMCVWKKLEDVPEPPADFLEEL